MKKFFVFIMCCAISFGITQHSAQAQIGSNCDSAHVISTLPFLATGLNTASSGNHYTSLPCSDTTIFFIPVNFMSGNDYLFSFTPTSNMNVRIKTGNTATAVGLFVTDACPDIATSCIAQHKSVAGNPVISSVNLTAGTTYYITVSSNSGISATTAFDIEIIELLPYDAAVTAVLSPVTECYLTNTEEVKIVIKNWGTQSISNFEIGYMLDGVAITPITIAGPLASGDTMSHVFTQTVDLSLAGTYNLKAYVSLTGDQNALNDTLEKDITHLATINTLPYAEDFELGSGGWAIGGTNPSWQLGNPSGTVINMPAVGGTNSWVTNLSGNHNLIEDSYVYSPCFNFGSYPNVSIKMDVWYQTMQMMGSARLEASLTGGAYWFIIGNNDEPTNWYNAMMTDTGWTGSSYAWLTAQHPLNYLGGQMDVRLRVRFKTGMMSFMTEEGFAFDNLLIYECNDMPTAGFTYVQNGSNISFTNTSQDATSYLWNFGDQMMMLPDTSTNPSYQYMAPGTYTVTLAAYNDCGVSYYSENINITTVGIEQKETSTLFIYPNPASDILNISIEDNGQANYEVIIYNALGKEVSRIMKSTPESQIQLTGLSKGLYFISIASDEFNYKRKFIIE